MSNTTNKARKSHPMTPHLIKSQGFTLVELLVTVVVLAIGLLGMAGLQTTGLSANQSAYHRSQATVAISDIIDRMRSNTTGVTNNDYVEDGSTLTVNTSTSTTGQDCIDNTAGCTPAELASHDIAQWARYFSTSGGNTPILPNASGAIARTGSNYIATITWEEITWNEEGTLKEAQNKQMVVNFFL